MGKVIASITTSVDGYITGPDDGPEYGLGRGGERLHYWVMGGRWTYEGGHDFAMHGPDKEFYEGLVSTVASGGTAAVCTRRPARGAGRMRFPGPCSYSLTASRTSRRPRPASASSQTSRRHSPRRLRRPGTATSPSVAAPTSSGRRLRRGRSTSWSSRRLR